MVGVDLGDTPVLLVNLDGTIVAYEKPLSAPGVATQRW